MFEYLQPQQHSRHPCASPTLELTQTQVYWVGNAIQPSHSLSSASPPTFNLFHNQGLFQGVRFLHLVAKVLELQHHSFQWIFRTDFLYGGLVGSPCSPRNSQESSPGLACCSPWGRKELDMTEWLKWTELRVALEIHLSMQEKQEMPVWSLGQENPLEDGMATHSSFLAWRIPWTEEHGRLQSMSWQRVDMTEWLSTRVAMIQKLDHTNHREEYLKQQT